MKSTVFSLFRKTRQSNFLFLIIILLPALIISCGPKKKYVGPYLPDEEIAIIKPDDKMFTPVKILSIDKNVPLYTDESSIAVHPGKHTLFLEAALDYPFLDKYLYFNQYLTFNAEAGQVYTLHASILPMRNEGFAWITSDRDPDKFIVKKYAVGLIPLSTYP
ncbi:MAG: hypothetical protein HF978_18760 [Desulfobacteraceae bacterium]|nr:hypothetical protein [Desulfobacteraceae bacterium]MBC2757589.1 hypothetical protein [Desulfobacteraceae bacterium]